jgi:diguanylate cyclase (GGDEF)-like protein
MQYDANEQLELSPRFAGQLYRQTRAEAIGVGLAGLVFAWLCSGTVTQSALYTWGAVVVVTVTIRLWLQRMRRSQRSRGPRSPVWFYLFVAGATVLGAAFGALAYKAVGNADILQASTILFWLAFTGVCAIPIYGGVIWPVLGFAVPALLPASLAMLSKGNPQASAVGVIILVALALIILAARVMQRTNSRLLSLEDDMQQLRGVLDSRREEIEKLNQSVRVYNEQRQQAEGEARRAVSDLGLMKSKAQALSETLSRISPLCPVTGIANRRTLEEHLEAEWRRQMRLQKPLSLLMCELDEFEGYRENYGAQSADGLLHRVARLAAAVGRRPGDLAARYDGACIAVLLPGCDSRNAVRMAEALRKRVEQQKIPHESAKAGDAVTVHVGVATLIPIKDYPATELLQRIDTAMYEARFQGGNKVIAYRTMDKLKLEHWDPKKDDLLTKHTLLQKIMVRGFRSRPVQYPPSSVLPDKSSEKETVCALLQGELRLIIEGESMLLKPGDCIYIPPHTTYGAEVVSAKDVVGYEGSRAD